MRAQVAGVEEEKQTYPWGGDKVLAVEEEVLIIGLIFQSQDIIIKIEELTFLLEYTMVLDFNQKCQVFSFL